MKTQIACMRKQDVHTVLPPDELELFFRDSFFDFPLIDDARLPKRIAAYSLLRSQLLELLVGRNECKEMRLSYPHYGAIAIEASGFEQKVWVNVSYSGEYVMSGVSDTPIGVDVQKVRRISDAVFEELLSQDEKAFAYDFSLIERCQLFSLKESFSKAVQLGMKWPAAYAAYTDKLSLHSSLLPARSYSYATGDEDYVASVSFVPEKWVGGS